MLFFSLYKKLKKQLRRKKRILALGIWLTFAVTIASGAWMFDHSLESKPVNSTLSDIQYAAEPEHEQNVLQRIQDNPIDRMVYHQITYVCGKSIVALGKMKAAQIIHLHEQNPKWFVGINQDESIYFVEQITDLSPECKKNAYFSVDKQGNLSLFDGLPAADKVIQTFFQLDLEKVVSSLPKGTLDQLYAGIHVNDLTEYNSVLSTFSDYSVEKTARTMKPN
ncbi:MAG: hypothetical protein A2189_00090 [Paenibacillus sp. RIFOXYA1_FULL_44_5]|nr:MAG: hypothetical protein A2189_00090 [Paenibacillus sp. RIFOXYA1_FULL_44_5]